MKENPKKIVGGKEKIQTDKKGVSRRGFLGSVAAGVAVAATSCSHYETVTVVPPETMGRNGHIPPSETLLVGGIGVGGRGSNDVNAVAEVEGTKFVCLCDVDEDRASGTFKKFPDAKRYKDFRVMLEKESGIDAVVIGAPDHVHAAVALMAMDLKKHVYVEKPMASSICEVRAMTESACRNNVVTQVGNQGHSGEGLRHTYEMYHGGAIGTIEEVHSWSNRPIWPQGIPRPNNPDPVPETINWDLWLGPVLWRPYHQEYAPFKWRGYCDFGTGAMGDMAVHNADPAFFVLGLGAPDWIEAESSGCNGETFPDWQIIKYHFAATDKHPELIMTWYDGGKKPPLPEEMKKEGRELGKNGIIFVGDKGKMLGGSHASPCRLIPESSQKEYGKPKQLLPRSPGHHKEWVLACKKGDKSGALANFDYSGPFTEALLTGVLATYLNKRIEWDSENLRCPNAPEADRYINKHYRPGWGMLET